MTGLKDSAIPTGSGFRSYQFRFSFLRKPSRLLRWSRSMGILLNGARSIGSGRRSRLSSAQLTA